jgi:hypothetical protein
MKPKTSNRHSRLRPRDLSIGPSTQNPLPLHVALIPTVSRSQKNVKLLLGARLGQFQLQRRGPFLDDSVVGFDLQAEAGLQSFELFLTRVPVKKRDLVSMGGISSGRGPLGGGVGVDDGGGYSSVEGFVARYTPVKVHVDITTQVLRDLQEDRFLAEMVAEGGTVPAIEDVRLDPAAFGELDRVVFREALDRFLDGVHVGRDQSGVRVGFWGLELGAEAGEGLLGS